MDIEDVLFEQEAPHYTQRRPILRGSFNASKASIPFFQATVTIEEAAKELELVENLPSDLRSKWRLEELFQREIDWRRVKHEIVEGYLKRPEKLQFFNAITVALLPINAQKILVTEYGDTPIPPNVPEKYTRPPWTVSRIGGVELITGAGSSYGQISWDPKRIFPATIDGQHRLAALQTLYREGNLTNANLATAVPVIFLVLDGRAGLNLDAFSYEDQNPILTIVREIFIDLNKSARAVTRARRILLDDQEIESRCVRELIASRIGERTEDRLPLGLVHWQHKVTAKFNAGNQTGPFITTVELLYAIVSDILNLAPPKDPNEEGQINRFITSVEKSLDVSGVIARNQARYPDLPPLRSYVEQYYLREGFEQPLASLPSPYLRACNQAFNERWRQLIVGVMMQFKPYANFIAEVDKRGGIDGDLAYYLSLPSRAQQQQVKDWGEARHEKLDRPLRELAELKQNDWPFFAVFQKGLILATADAWLSFGKASSDTSGDIEAFLKEWLSFLDGLWDKGVLAVHAPLKEGQSGFLWAGIALNQGAKTVKWNKITVDRISGLLQLWWYFHHSRMQQITRFIKALVSPKRADQFPQGKQSLENIRRSLQGIVVGPDEEPNEKEIEKRVSARIKEILAYGRNNDTLGSGDDEDSLDADDEESLQESSSTSEE